MSENRKRNKQQDKITAAKYYQTHKEQIKLQAHKYRIKKNYGLSVEDFDELLQKQGGVCAICNRVHKSSRRLCVDHNHKTGKVRGLLCNNCNQIIVSVVDNIPGALKRLNHYMST